MTLGQGWNTSRRPAASPGAGSAEAVGVELKQVLRWRNGTEPCGGAFYSLVRLSPWIPGGPWMLMGEDFLSPLTED